MIGMADRNGGHRDQLATFANAVWLGMKIAMVDSGAGHAREPELVRAKTSAIILLGCCHAKIAHHSFLRTQIIVVEDALCASVCVGDFLSSFRKSVLHEAYFKSLC